MLIRFPGVEGFEGVVRRGMGGDVALEDFRGKRVVVVGMGAFGVENVRRALRGGASSVTLLSRRFDKLLFPERVSYLLRSRLQASDAFEDENLVRSFEEYRYANPSGSCLAAICWCTSCMRLIYCPRVRPCAD